MNLLELKLGFLKQWFINKGFLIEKFFSDIPKSYPYCQSGEVYYADLGVNIGCEIDKKRPVLVIQNDSIFRQSNLVSVLPFTTSLEKKGEKTTVFIDLNDYIWNDKKVKNSLVLVDQVRVISKTRLGNRVGEISRLKREEVKQVLRKVLGI